MKTLERYVFCSFLSSFLLAFLVLSFVLTIGLMVKIVGYIIQGLPLGLVGSFAFVSFPETLQWTIPLGLLVASVLVFSRMSADSEIAAMRACGVNLFSVLKWPFVFALCCTCVGLFINNEIVPRGHEVRRQLARRIGVGNGLELLEPGRIIDDFPKMKLFFESKQGNWLNDLVAIDYSNPKFERMITARKTIVQEDGRDICLDLTGVTVDPLDEEHPGMAYLGRLPYRIKDALKDKKYNRKEKDYRFFELLGAVRRAGESSDAASKAAAAAEGEEAVQAKQKKRFMKRYHSDLKTEFMRRFVFAFASVCFVFVGVPLGIRAQRKESSVGMAISLAVALSYYLIVILMTTFSKNASMHPEWLIWLPVVLCAALAAYLLPKHL